MKIKKIHIKKRNIMSHKSLKWKTKFKINKFKMIINR